MGAVEELSSSTLPFPTGVADCLLGGIPREKGCKMPESGDDDGRAVECGMRKLIPISSKNDLATVTESSLHEIWKVESFSNYHLSSCATLKLGAGLLSYEAGR